MSDLEHNQQIFAGFELLRVKGEIDFNYSYDVANVFGLDPDLVRANVSAASVIICRIDGIGDVAFDLSDGDVVVKPIYERVCIYFKRSYSMSAHAHKDKVLPLGLNYEARGPIRSFGTAIFRAMRLYRTPRTTGRAICRALHLPYPHILTPKSGCSLIPERDPRVLFVARVYDPLEQGSTPTQRSEITLLNDMRADCVLRLRREFGTEFTGGLISDGFSMKHYSDCTVPQTFPTDRRSFLQLIDRHHICVATTGLFDSIGWKFAEYLAKGRAVVSEPLRFSVPGPLSDGVNYLSFSTASECANQCRVLYADTLKMRNMMIANRAYYLGYVEPQAIVWNALQVLLATRASRSNQSEQPGVTEHLQRNEAGY